MDKKQLIEVRRANYLVARFELNLSDTQINEGTGVEFSRLTEIKTRGVKPLNRVIQWIVEEYADKGYTQDWFNTDRSSTVYKELEEIKAQNKEIKDMLRRLLDKQDE